MPDIRERLRIDTNVIQAPMGGISRANLVSAVAKAGGLGSLGFLAPQLFESEITKLKEELNGQSFAANLLFPMISKAHVKACIRYKVPVVSFFYGYDREVVQSIKESGAFTLFQVGSIEEARKVAANGIDGIVVQGVEAGGHVRGSERLHDLLPRVRDEFPDHLVVASGGIYDNASASAAIASGADGVASGTRFLATYECDAHPKYKERVVDSDTTVLTNLFGVGWRDPHRVIPNAAVNRWCEADGREPGWLKPVHQLTQFLSRLASSEENTSRIINSQTLNRPLYTPASLSAELSEAMIEVVALYAGECVSEIGDIRPASDVVSQITCNQ